MVLIESGTKVYHAYIREKNWRDENLFSCICFFFADKYNFHLLIGT